MRWTRSTENLGNFFSNSLCGNHIDCTLHAEKQLETICCYQSFRYLRVELFERFSLLGAVGRVAVLQVAVVEYVESPRWRIGIPCN